MDNNYEQEMEETLELFLIDETEIVPVGGASKYDPDVKAFDYVHSKDGEELISRMRMIFAEDDEDLSVPERLKIKIKNADKKEELITIREEIQKLPASKERNSVILKYNEKVRSITLKK
jgi:hypothetical protein